MVDRSRFFTTQIAPRRNAVRTHTCISRHTSQGIFIEGMPSLFTWGCLSPAFSASCLPSRYLHWEAWEMVAMMRRGVFVAIMSFCGCPGHDGSSAHLRFAVFTAVEDGGYGFIEHRKAGVRLEFFPLFVLFAVGQEPDVISGEL